MVVAPAVGLKSILKKKISSRILAESEGIVGGLGLSKKKEECVRKESVNEKNGEVFSTRNRGHTPSMKRGRGLTEYLRDLVEVDPDLPRRKRERMANSQGSNDSLQRKKEEDNQVERPVGGQVQVVWRGWQCQWGIVLCWTREESQLRETL